MAVKAATGRLPIARPWLLLAAAALTAVAALWGGELAGSALRAAAVVACLGLTAAALLSRPADSGRPAPLEVVARRPLAREAGVAVVTAGERTFVVGYGTAGVAVLAELGQRPGAAPPEGLSPGGEHLA
jgi:hypothetical protein